jgi:hypothetical protein
MPLDAIDLPPIGDAPGDLFLCILLLRGVRVIGTTGVRMAVNSSANEGAKESCT